MPLKINLKALPYILLLGLIFMGSFQLMSMGLIGEYIDKIIIQVKGRPIYIINEDTSLASMEGR